MTEQAKHTGAAAREIIEVLADQADRAADGRGWSHLVLERMAVCAQRLIAAERRSDPIIANRGADLSRAVET